MILQITPVLLDLHFPCRNLKATAAILRTRGETEGRFGKVGEYSSQGTFSVMAENYSAHKEL